MTARALLTLALGMAMMGSGTSSPARGQDTIFVVRHAEKAATPASDPGLSTEGKERAQALRALLGDAGISAIITTPTIRSQETAAPLATALGLTPISDPMTDPKVLVERLRTLSGNVLVVGHTNTIPALLKELGHPSAVTIAEAEFDNLFVVTPGRVTRPAVLRLHYRR